MQKITLYHYTRPNGGVTVSPVMPSEDYTVMYRLVADESFILTDGEIFTYCTDATDPSVWSEVEYNEEQEDTIEEYSEIEQKARAFDILMGVSE